MTRQEPVDPLARERFGRVWPGFEATESDAAELAAPGPGDFEADSFDRVSDIAGVSAVAAVRGSLGDRAARGAVAGPAALTALNPGRRAVKALAAVAIVVVLIAGFVAWRSQPHAIAVTAATSPPSPVGSTAPAAAGPSAAGLTTSESAAATIVVAVSGRVRRPGLVRLPAGSRVADAIAAAGGALPGTDLSFVNLARKVSDGELIVIGITPSPGQTFDDGTGDPSAGSTPGALVNLNTATEAQFDTLPGIGPALAQRIIDYRTQHGAFRSVDQLQQVSGIGEAKFAEIKGLVTV